MKSKKVEHNGHKIEVAARAHDADLLIDGEPVRWGQFSGDGQFFLYRYAYDPDDSLIEVARRYVEYRERVEQHRAAEE
jgi:hypothetical protein